MKLKTRLSLSFFFIIAVVAGVSFVFIQNSTQSLFRSFVFSGDSEKAQMYASIFAEYYAEHKSWDGLQAFLSEMPQIVFQSIDDRIHGEPSSSALSAYSKQTISALLSDRIAVADSSGVIVADSAEKILHTVHPATHLRSGIPIISGSRRVGTVLVGSMIDSSLTGMNQHFLDSVLRSLILGILISSCLAFFLSLVFSSRITRPIASLNNAAKRVAQGDFEVSVSPEGDEELRSLSISFNAMIGELNNLENAKKQIIADAAHELRTPVTLIQGTLEGMLDGVFPVDTNVLSSVYEETLRLSSLIDKLRKLEIIESGKLELTLSSVNVSEMIRHALTVFRSLAQEKNIDLWMEPIDSSLTVEADSFWLSEAIYNLLSNAVKYTPNGGKVRVHAHRVDSTSIRIQVDDSGPGIPSLEREQIFERFYRIDKSRSSSSGGRGLGLAITKQIISAHGGTIRVETSNLGGASFIVELFISARP